MELGGWIFSKDDGSEWTQAEAWWRPRNDQYCRVPWTSYCGFAYPGNGMLSYTFTFSGTADFRYGQSWHKGSVHVKKNEEEISSLDNTGSSDVTFDFSAGDVLEIYEIEESVFNIHSLVLTKSGA